VSSGTRYGDHIDGGFIKGELAIRVNREARLWRLWGLLLLIVVATSWIFRGITISLEVRLLGPRTGV